MRDQCIDARDVVVGDQMRYRPINGPSPWCPVTRVYREDDYIHIVVHTPGGHQQTTMYHPRQYVVIKRETA